MVLNLILILINKKYLDTLIQSSVKKSRTKRSYKYLIDNIHESSLIKNINESNSKTHPHLLETKNNKHILSNFESLPNRARRFVDRNKQLDTKVYCEK